MSADGCTSEVTIVDHDLVRRVVIDRLYSLSQRATELSEAAGHTSDIVDVLLAWAADNLTRHGTLLLDSDVRFLRRERIEADTLTDHSTEGAYYRAVVALLDEGIALLRGLQ